MTKTLTEQWKDGKLPVGSYYINLIGAVERVDFFEGLEWERTKDFGIEEVLAPVPSYDKVKEMSQKIDKLKKQLEIAKKALNDILNDGDDYWDKDKANEAITKMEGVK